MLMSWWSVYNYIILPKKGYLYILDNEVRKDDDICLNNYVSMRENAMDYINSYVAKKFDDEFILVW